MAGRWSFWKYARTQTDREYQRTGFYNGYWEQGFFKNQLIINAVMGVLWLVISVAGTGVFLSWIYRIIPVYQMIQDNEYQSNLGTMSFIQSTLRLLSLYVIPQVLSPLVIRGFRMLTALRQGSSIFTESPPDENYVSFYIRYISVKFDRLFLTEKCDSFKDKIAGSMGLVYLRKAFGVLIMLAAFAMSFGCSIWLLSDVITGTDISELLFWGGLGIFVMVYGLSHLIAYLYWRSHANQIMAAEAEAAKESESDGEHTSGSTAE